MTTHRRLDLDELPAVDDPWWNNTSLALLFGCVLFALSDIAAAIRQHTDVVLTAVAAVTPIDEEISHVIPR